MHAVALSNGSILDLRVVVDHLIGVSHSELSAFNTFHLPRRLPLIATVRTGFASEVLSQPLQHSDA